jgi:hypothetical protein
MQHDKPQQQLSSSQRLLLAAVLAAAAAYCGIMWSGSGAARDALGGIALLATAIYVRLYPVQSTSSLFAQYQSSKKPPLLAAVLHMTALIFFLATLATWMR